LLVAVLSILAPMRAAMAQPLVSLMAEPEIKLKGRNPFTPELVTVAWEKLSVSETRRPRG